MLAKVKCVAEDLDGFKAGSVYPVLGFGSTVCMVRDDENNVVAIGHDKFNDKTMWELQPLEGDKKPKHDDDDPPKRSAK